MLVILLQLLLINDLKGQILGRNRFDNRWPMSSPNDFGMMGTTPGMQRMPFAFMAFPSGGKTENGLDLELITKNAVMEINRQRALSAAGAINQFGDGLMTPEITGGGLSRQMIPNVAPRGFGSIPRELGSTAREFSMPPGMLGFPSSSLPPPPPGFPRRTDFPNSMDFFKPPVFPRPGILPMTMSGLPEFVPLRSDHSSMKSNFERSRKPEEIVDFNSDQSFKMIDNDPSEKFMRNESDTLNPPMNSNYYGPDFYGSMMRAPFNYYYNRWWPPSRIAAGAEWNPFQPLSTPIKPFLFRQPDFGMGGGRILKRLNAAKLNNEYAKN